ncbi:MAG: M4 family metallopeptidase [Vicinamibacterales bacterium]
MPWTCSRLSVITIFATFISVPIALAQSSTGSQAREQARQRLEAATGGAVVASEHKSTGAARFIRVQPGSPRGLSSGPAATAGEKAQHSVAFFRDYGALIGVSDPASLRLTASTTDAIGETHLTWQQFYGAIPVFAGTVKTHFDRANRLKAVTGTAIPDIVLDPTPTWPSARAAQVARAAVVAERGDSDALRTGAPKLYVYREGLAQGVPGVNHLAWEIEVTDGAGIRDLVYVGAHSGKVIDSVSAVRDEMFRRAYDGHSLPFVPQNYPNGAYWLEGQQYPTGSQEANNMLAASKETYDFFKQTFGRDSFDGKGAVMDAIFDRGYSCPNASWNGLFISFCPGTTTDDVTAHEWGHAYTEHTHGLIYQWQPGALNESYSDIWGEVIDQINNRGTDSPSATRAAASCSSFSPPVFRLVVNSPAALAGSYFANAAQFGPQLTSTLTRDVVAALDEANAAGPSTFDGCTALTNATAVAGKIALINRGTCEFSRKVLNAQQAGAAAAIIADNSPTGLVVMGPGAVGSQVTIPSISVQQSTGTAIRAQLSASAIVNVSIGPQAGTDASYKWLIGEDADAFGGALRDMWNPTCYSNPGKVSDPFYLCSTADAGGVHINSGIPNHGFALLVDGGAYNSRTIAPIGLTKAAHIYYRAQSVYQVFDSDFADHADALEASCSDLAGQALTALNGGPASEVITAGDCSEVTKMIAAVELRTPPTFCNFAPLLDPRTAASCSTATTTGVTQGIASFDFETDPSASWTASRSGTAAGFTPRDWTWTSGLPDGNPGSGFFAPDPNIGSCTAQNEAGVLELTSPDIVLPPSSSFARATFEHWVATEPGFDGGNLAISVNGGSWQLVPPSEFTFNNYTALLFTAAQGNTNPLAGQPAWTGTDAGSVNDGSWGRSHVNLGNLAHPGDSIRLRWNFGTDGCAGRTGWYLDNVSVFSCTPRVPSISVADVSIAEGNAGETQLAFTVLLSTPTINAVSVNYEVVDGTAAHGNDFDRVAGTIVIPASTATQGFTSARILVNIKGDIVPEGNETLVLRLSGAVNATIADGEAVGTIVDDDTTPPGPPRR